MYVCNSRRRLLRGEEAEDVEKPDLHPGGSTRISTDCDRYDTEAPHDWACVCMGGDYCGPAPWSPLTLGEVATWKTVCLGQRSSVCDARLQSCPDWRRQIFRDTVTSIMWPPTAGLCLVWQRGGWSRPFWFYNLDTLRRWKLNSEHQTRSSEEPVAVRTTLNR